MACEGELPGLDAAIFADTGWEPTNVYDWLERELIPRARAAEIPLYVVRTFDDGRDLRTVPWYMPLWIRSEQGDGMLRRQCTNTFKIRPIRRQMRELLGRHPRPGDVEQWLGISWDEAERMRDSAVRYVVNRYPLIDARMTRADCHAWLARRGLDAPRSACIGCPFRTDSQWLQIKRDPKLWAQAVEVDAALRTDQSTRPSKQTTLHADAYLHSSRVPLDEVQLRHENQLELFGCDGGHCGV
jgi:hypothetical protein